jgi:branched-chain amino acid transport system substrate-binding protein
MRLGLLAVAALLAGAPHVHAAELYTIEVLLPLTGPGALLGTTEQKALQRFETVYAKGKEIGGRPVHFAFHDDQSNPQTAVQLANEIIAKKPAVMLGSALVAMCNATTPLVRRGPVEYCFSPGIRPAAGGFVFSGSVSTKDLGASLLRYFRMKGWTKLALITSTDASGQDAARNMHELFAEPENKELSLVAEQTFNPSDISAAAQVERLKGAEPQAVIAWSTGAAIGVVFKAIQDSGLAVPVATTDGNQTYATMERFAAILPKELYIPSPEWPMSDKIQDEPSVK